MNGKEAYEQFEKMFMAPRTCLHCKFPFYSLIVMDLNMPVMDGFEASERILSLFRSHPEKALYGTHNVNIVALTSYTDQSTIDRCQHIGMAEVYHKPLKKEEMREMIAI